MFAVHELRVKILKRIRNCFANLGETVCACFTSSVRFCELMSD